MSKQNHNAVARAEAAAVSKAEELVASLQQRLAAHDEAGVQLTTERGSISFRVHGDGDPKARERLTEINNLLIGNGSERESLVAALREAEVRLQAAQQAQAREQRRAALKEQQKLSAEFRKIGGFLDRSTADLRRGLIALQQNAASVGKDFRHVGALHRVLQVAFFDTVFRDAFGVPDAPTRQSFSTFAGVVNGWCDSCDASLAHELAALDGTEQKEERAA